MQISYVEMEALGKLFDSNSNLLDLVDLSDERKKILRQFTFRLDTHLRYTAGRGGRAKKD